MALLLSPGKSLLILFGTVNLSSRKDIKGANFHELFQLANEGAVHRKAFQSLLDFIQIKILVLKENNSEIMYLHFTHYILTLLIHD